MAVGPNRDNVDVSDRYNLTTDPESYPYFTSFQERGEYIRQNQMITYLNRLETQIKSDIRAIADADSWAEPQFRQWARENSLPGDLPYELSAPDPDTDDSEESETESDSDDEVDLPAGEEEPPFDRAAYDFRQAPHMPRPRQRLGRKFLTRSPPPYHHRGPPRFRADDEGSSNSLRGSPRLGSFSVRDEQSPNRGRSRERNSRERSRSPLSRSPGHSRERSRSPSRRSPGLERRGSSPGSSLGRRATRAEFLAAFGGRRSGSSSPQRGSSSTGWGAGFNSPQGSGSPGRGARSSSPQGSGSPGREARSWSGDPGSTPRASRPNSPQGSVPSPGRNPASPQYVPVAEDESELEEDITEMPTLKELFEREVYRRMRPWMMKFYMPLVGEQAHEGAGGFRPRRGDLIISYPDSRHIGLRNSVGYIASYLGEPFHFTPRNLVLRVGNFDVIPGSAVFQGLSLYKPFSSVELYAYRPRSDRSDKSPWRFMGHQAELRNVIVRNDEHHVSPGKFLSVGFPVLASSSNFIESLVVPRRGDIIMKREVWTEDFSHPENFWYSMVKWHRGIQFSFLRGDMLVRRLLDIARNQEWGWAELYQYEGTSVGWIFWGRTQHVYDTPWPDREPDTFLYEYDHGKDSDDEIQKERVRPRWS